MANLVVTGAAGMIGAALATRCRDRGDRVVDLVSGILLAGAAPAAAGRVYNLAGPQVPCRTFFGHHARHVGTSLRSLPRVAARAAASMASLGAQAFGRPAPFGPEAIEYVTHPGGYATVRARTGLGWAPEVELGEGLTRSFAGGRRVSSVDAAPWPVRAR